MKLVHVIKIKISRGITRKKIFELIDALEDRIIKSD
jgi:hypothetical protein